MQGTRFAFVSVLFVIAKTQGLGVALTACLIGGIIHFFLGTIIGRIRFLFPPLVSGLVILTIGLYLIPVAIKYAAGGAAKFQMEAASYGSLMHWTVAGSVIVVSFILKFWGKGLVSSAALLIGLIAGYVLAWIFGMVYLGGVTKAEIIAIPNFMPY